jgi:peptidyl-prolyl cis-trans isomerase C
VTYAVVAIIAASFLASGCNRKAEGQTVAVVNGEEVTLSDLNFALQSANLPDHADKSAARAQVLSQLVDRRLIAEAAKKEGIDKSPEYLNRVRRADEDLLISMLAARRLKTAQLPSDSEVSSFIAGHPNMFDNRQVWKLDQVQFATPTDAGIAAEVKATNTMAELLAVLQKHNIAVKQQKNQLDTASMRPEIYAQVNALKPNEPFVVPVGKMSVASVITERVPQPIGGDQAKPVAVNVIRKTQTAKTLESMLKSLQSQAKIEYQPGYAPPKK